MSANFNLSLANPAVTSGPANVAYSGQGNTLALAVSNNFGSALMIGGSSNGTYLFIGVSENVMDADGAEHLAVSSPWTIASYDPPGGTTPIGQGNYVFYLLPPAGGQDLPEGNSTPVTLTNLQLSAVGSGQVAAYYDFDGVPGDALDATAPFSVLSPPNPELPDLFPTGLSLTLYVNDDDATNPIMVTVPPVTSESAVDNSVHLNFAYQGSSNLATSWDPSNPPTLRLSFAYYSATSGLPAYLDLTDCFKPADPGYNPITSAWNIPVSLDPSNPDIQNDGMWQITPDPNAVVPVWMIQPDTANANLFTATQNLDQPGPFLDVFALDIVCGLPINTDHPETLMYLQWNNFPGFNDGLASYTLTKTSLNIDSFAVEVVRNGTNVQLQATWATTGADHCLITGTSALQAPTTQPGSPYTVDLTPELTMLSSYTLTAVATDDQAQVSKTVSAQWQINQTLGTISYNWAAGIQTIPAGNQFFVEYYSSNYPATRVVQPYDIGTLSPATSAIASNGNMSAFVVTASGGAVFYNDFYTAVYGNDLTTGTPIPNSGTNPVGNVAVPSLLGASPDGSKVLMVTVDMHFGNKWVGVNQLVVMNSTDLSQIGGSPFPLSAYTGFMTVSPQTGNCFLSQNQIVVLDGNTYVPVAGSPAVVANPGPLALSPDGTTLYTVSTDQNSNVSYLVKVGVESLQVLAQTQIPVGWTNQFFQMGWAPGSISVSADGNYVFFHGIDPSMQSGQFLVYDTTTMQEMSWSPLQSLAAYSPLGLAMTPDGTRLFALVVMGMDGEATLFVIDPVFS